MRVTVGLLFLSLLSIAGCSQRESTSHSVPQADNRATSWPHDWADLVGKKVTLEGTITNFKLGPRLQGDGDSIWIDDLNHWPEGQLLRVALPHKS